MVAATMAAVDSVKEEANDTFASNKKPGEILRVFLLSPIEKGFFPYCSCIVGATVEYIFKVPTF